MNIEGKRRFSNLLVLDNYRYRLSFKRSDTEYYRCAAPNGTCTARLIRRGDVTTPSGEHNHYHQGDEIAKDQFLASLKKRVEQEPGSLRSIFNDEILKTPEAARSGIEFKHVENTLHRRRRSVFQAALPQNVEEFIITLQEKHLSDKMPFFHAAICGENESRTVVFVHERLCAEVLASTDEIHIDGTFKVVPNFFKQLCIIYASFMNHFLPCVFALMTHKTVDDYKNLLNYIKTQSVPGFSPQSILTDYDLSLRLALQDTFPTSTIQSCWYHYVQCIRWQTDRLQLREVIGEDLEAKRLLQKLMVLPFLPTSLIPEAFQDLRDATNDERLNDLMTYMHDQWISRAQINVMSVYEEDKRTCNHVETFHRMLLQKVGSRLNAWSFLAKLEETSNAEYKDFQRMTEGLPVKRQRLQKFLSQDNKIRKAIAELQNGAINATDFVTKMYHTTYTYANTIEAVLVEDDIAVDEDVPCVESESVVDMTSEESELNQGAVIVINDNNEYEIILPINNDHNYIVPFINPV